MIKKTFCLILFTTIFSSLLFSQSGRKNRSKNYERIKAKKIAFITDEVDLTPAESEKFWPIYNQYRKEFDALREDRHRSYDDLKNLSEEEALATLEKSILNDKKEIELKEKYNVQFIELISAKRLIKLHSVERRFKRDMLMGIKDRYSSRSKKKS